jgi:hypothetical protein
LRKFFFFLISFFQLKNLGFQLPTVLPREEGVEGDPVVEVKKPGVSRKRPSPKITALQ